MRGGSPYLWICALSSALLAACPNDVRDSHCSPDETGLTDDCIFSGEGRGPKVSEPLCPDVTGELPSVCPSFEQVFEVLIDPARGNCSAGGCHGSEPGSAGIYLPVTDTGRFYLEMIQTASSAGRLYVTPDNEMTPENEALRSTIVCSLLGQPGGGFPMPKPGGMPNVADVDVVRDWVLCGAPGPRCAPEPGDSSCIACAKRACCDEHAACAADVECAPCLACVAMSGSAACAASCPMGDPEISALLACGSQECAMECAGGG